MPGPHPIDRGVGTRASGRTRRTLVAAVCAALVVPLLTATGARAANAPVVPTPGRVLPAAVDAATSYRQQYSCDPVAKPGLEAYARLLLQTYPMGRSGGIVRGCGIGATSEHKEGRAFDFMLSVKVPEQKAAGDALTQWLTGKDANGVLGGNARRMGIMYVIWNKKIWSTYNSAGWRAYSGSNPHTDHVHTSFSWDGAEGRTSWWTGTATTNVDQGPCRVYSGQPAPVYTTRRTSACPTSLLTAPTSRYGIVWPGQSGSSVKVAQARLGVSADGVFGSMTRSTLFSWQRTKSLPVTGVLDKPTWAKLVPDGTPDPVDPPPDNGSTDPGATTTMLTPYKGVTLVSGARGAAVTAAQQALGVSADGVYGPATAAAVAAFQRSEGLPANGVMDPATWARLEAVAYPLLPYRSTTLRNGSKGAAVSALQKALKVSADGSFGSITETAVKAAQARAGLTATGVVDVATWVAVEAAAYPLGSTGAKDVPSVPTTRLSGTDRYATAARIAAEFGTGVPTAFIASGADFPDALAGAAAAGGQRSPVLLTSAKSVPLATVQALMSLSPRQIVVLGGPGAISRSVEKTLGSYTKGSVLRLEGADRYATAARVATYVSSVGVDVAYVASGTSFPDALAGAALAGSKDRPVLLTGSKTLAKATTGALKTLKPKQIVILGGTGAVSASVQAQLKAYTSGSVTRLSGADRYATAAEVATAMGARAGAVYVANGLVFPDALAGAALAGRNGSPVLLVGSGTVPSATIAALGRLSPTSITVLGGVGPVPGEVATALGSFSAG